jgi:Rrf2 family protein
MLLTRETDYALRLLRGLADGEQVTAAELSAREQVPRQFAYKILKKLQRAGLISIQRGAEGGCTLAAGLGEVSLRRLMQAMEEDAAVSACMRPDYECQWCRAHCDAVCRAHIHLAAIQEKLDRELEAHSLAEILFGD